MNYLKFNFLSSYDHEACDRAYSTWPREIMVAVGLHCCVVALKITVFLPCRTVRRRFSILLYLISMSANHSATILRDAMFHIVMHVALEVY